MPNPNFQPNQPGYYESDRFWTLSGVMGLAGPDDDDRQVAYENNENLRAFVSTLLPTRITRLEVCLDHLKYLCPSHSMEGLDQEARRQLSEDARNAIFDHAVAVRRREDGVEMNSERVYSSLLEPITGPEAETRNNQVRETVLTGTPQQRGQLFEEKIRRAATLLDEDLSNKDDAYLVRNFADIYDRMDIVSNAQNIRALQEKGDITLSENAMEILRKLESESVQLNAFTFRMQLIANPMYEHIDYTQLNRVPQNTLFDAQTDLEDLNTAAYYEYLLATFTMRNNGAAQAEYKFWEELDRQTPDNRERLMVHLMDCDTNQIKFVPLNVEYRNPRHNTLVSHLENSPLIVTRPDGSGQCYTFKNNKLVPTSATEIRQNFLEDTRREMKAVSEGLEEANRGLFIGSKEYADVRKELHNFFRQLEALGPNPTSDQLQTLQPQLQLVVELCEAYMETKNPEDFKNAREERRYEAVQNVKLLCERTGSLNALQDMAMASDLTATMNFSNPVPGKSLEEAPFPSYEPEDLRQIIDLSYGQLQDPQVRIAPSNAGDAADGLRASIRLSLEQVALTPDAFDAGDARNIMSNIVVLEMVKQGRTTDPQNNILAGPVEKALAENPAAVIESIRNHPVFRSMTETVTPESFQHFVVSGAAKRMVETMTNAAVQQQDPDLSPEKQKGAIENVLS